MLPRLSTWLVVALAGAALASGCGSGSGSESTATSQTASTDLSSTPTNTAGAPTRSTTLPPTATLPATAPASPTTTSPTTGAPHPTTRLPSTTVPKAVPQSPQKIAGKQAVAVCKGAVHAQPTLSASIRVKLEKSCEKAATGGQSALEQVAHEVCLEIINTSKVPAGAPRERALATCRDQ